MSWLIESVIDDDTLEIISEKADIKRVEILESANLAVKQFLRANGIKIGANKAFINSKFKKGKSNEIVFTFSMDVKAVLALMLVITPVVVSIINLAVTLPNLKKIKELLADPEKEKELNKLLKEKCGADVKVKRFDNRNGRIVLEYINKEDEQ